MDPKQMLEIAKKAKKAQDMMKEIEVIGRSKSEMTAILLNGVNELDIKFQDELFESKLNAKKMEEEVKEAYKNAMKALDKERSSGQNMDTVREMFGL